MNTEDFGYKMARCAGIAYLDGKEAKPKYKELGYTGHRFFDTEGAQCHVAWNKEILTIAFRGTEVKELSDVKADLNVDSVKAEYFHGNVHEGFQTEVDKLWNIIVTYVMKNKKDRTIFVTGHSLGAAMATIVAARFYKLKFKLGGLYTYGSPRVGNKKFRDALGVNHYRFVNNSDDVTKIPFYHWGYRHHGNLRYINSKGKVKIGTDVWKRTLDRLKGRWQGFKNKNYFDGISDHSVDKYAAHLSDYTEV